MTETSKRIGWTEMPVLAELWGLPFDDTLVTAFIHALRPSTVRVIAHGGVMKSDAWPWRVTVMLDPMERIVSITQEVEVDLGNRYEHGFAVMQDLEKRLEVDW